MTCAAWPITWPCDTAETDPALVAAAEDAARDILWAASGRRLGVCSYVEGYWPACSCEACCGPYKGSDGQWRNGGAPAQCCRLLATHRPVTSVEAVWVQGVTIDPTTVFTDRSYFIRRGDCWPCDTECDDPPVVVSYTAGTPLPSGTAAAMGEVACEVLTGLKGDPCRLPSRAVSISRQGVTVDLGSPESFLESGRLGLPITDAWLGVVNPRGLVQRSKVFSPDLPRSAPVEVV